MTITSGAVLLTFVVFCRIAGCLMLMPGFGSSRVPFQVRLYIAVSATLVLAPLIIPVFEGDLANAAPPQMLQLIASETLIGATIGMMTRIFFLALQFMGTAAAMLSGFGGMPDNAVDESEPAPAVANILTLTATVLLFAMGLHMDVLRALITSYSIIPVTELFDPRFALGKVTDAASDSFFLIVQLTAPFLVFSLIVNFLSGILNKMTPMIPVYFITMPFMVAGGLLILFFTISEALTLFLSGFQAFLTNG